MANEVVIRHSFGNWTPPPFKEAVLSINQVGNGALTISTHYSTFGLTWSSTDVGVGDFTIVNTDGFPDTSKIWINGLGTGLGAGKHTAIPILNSNVISGYYYMGYNDSNSLFIKFYNTGGTLTELSTLIGSGVDISLPLIRVFP